MIYPLVLAIRANIFFNEDRAGYVTNVITHIPRFLVRVGYMIGTMDFLITSEHNVLVPVQVLVKTISRQWWVVGGRVGAYEMAGGRQSVSVVAN